MSTSITAGALLQLGGLAPEGSRVDVFQQIYWAFLILGTLVGVVVIAYMLYNAYKYRDTGERDDTDEEKRPQLGEIPEGGGKGKKLFLSFSLSAIIVISLVLWTYLMLLYVENPGSGQAQAQVQGGEGPMVVHVEGFQFGWEFEYPNGHTSSTLRVPEDRRVRLIVTSRDVFHNFGIPEFRVKSDAIPGERTSSWFIAEETGEYQAVCYELCGAGHSYMTADVIVMEPDAYQEWYASTNGTSQQRVEAHND